ncbi:alpha/beta hydrolase [Zhongshania sp. BJYM1]|uniref:alpha/beta hydrolase n=1 Tax=Zhongshania aquatica TaxID=2965069 RepID=UPI0022B43E50|nr:alpha/beta hydrolase [Marortus sp. BJYM1]
MATVFLMDKISCKTWRTRVLLLFLAVLVSGCESLLFFPQQQLIRTPADVGLNYRDVRFSTADGGEVHGWWLPAKDKALATVLFAHGNAENISTHLASVYWLPERHINVLLIDYRGYGESPGYPSVKGAQADIVGALDWLSIKSDQADLPLVVLGQSIGASLAGVAVARTHENYPNLAGVILDAGFTGYGDIAKKVAAGSWLTWLFQYPANWAMPQGDDLVDEIANISPLPLMLIHGRQDLVVPYSHSETLFAAAKQAKQRLSYQGGHIETFSILKNRDAVDAFIRDAAKVWRASQ